MFGPELKALKVAYGPLAAVGQCLAYSLYYITLPNVLLAANFLLNALVNLQWVLDGDKNRVSAKWSLRANPAGQPSWTESECCTLWLLNIWINGSKLSFLEALQTRPVNHRVVLASDKAQDSFTYVKWFAQVSAGFFQLSCEEMCGEVSDTFFFFTVLGVTQSFND